MTMQSLLMDLEQRTHIDNVYLSYHEARRTPQNTSPAMPPEMLQMHTPLPWCRMCVSVLEERQDIKEITSQDQAVDDYLNNVWKSNSMDEKASQLATESMAIGRAYLVVTPGDDYPVLQVVPANQMVHKRNLYTGKTEEALRVYGYHRDKYAYYSPGKIEYLAYVNGVLTTDPDAPAGAVPSTEDVPVFPFISRGYIDDRWGRPEAKDIFGLQDAATRVMTDLSVASNLMAVPQRVLTGTEPGDLTNEDGTLADPAKLYTARLLTLSNPTAGVAQFQAAQLQNFTTTLNAMAREAAALMGVPQPVFGVSSDANPASARAQNQDDLRLVHRVERISRGFKPAYLDALNYIASAYGGFNDSTIDVIFVNPATPTIESQADAVVKLASVQVGGVPLYPRKALLKLLGLSDDQIDAMDAEAEDDAFTKLLKGTDIATATGAPTAGDVNAPAISSSIPIAAKAVGNYPQ